jgi:two-component system, NarL family, sensor kinase
MLGSAVIYFAHLVGQESRMSERCQRATYHVAPPQGSERHIFLGALLQWALRAVLIVFVTITLLFEPPNSNKSICAFILAAYVLIVACWSVWTLRPTVRAVIHTKKLVTLLVLGADVAIVSILSVLTGITSPESWTSDVLRNGLFLIPLVAAAQLNPDISAAMAIPTVSALVAVSWINKSANQEPWTSILLSATVLAALAAGSVALSRIQRSRVDMIRDLARQRTQLLDELLGLEKRERETLSERLHDGALQYVLAARQDLEEVRSGSIVAVDRVESSLAETSHLLRDVVRELHPEVLARAGLKSAITQLTDSIITRTDLAVDLESRTWPDALRTGADHVLYGAAREILANAIKHAHAHNVYIELRRKPGLAFLRIADDGVGISPASLSRSVESGHIGLASIRAKVLACGGHFDVRANFPGTQVTISIPLRQPADGAEFGPNVITLAGASQLTR